ERDRGAGALGSTGRRSGVLSAARAIHAGSSTGKTLKKPEQRIVAWATRRNRHMHAHGTHGHERRTPKHLRCMLAVAAPLATSKSIVRGVRRRWRRRLGG